MSVLARERPEKAKMTSNIRPLSCLTLTKDYKDISALMKTLSLEVEKFVRTSSEMVTGPSCEENDENNTLTKLVRFTSLLDAYQYLILQEDSSHSTMRNK
jgi:hypothetical protein